MAPALRRRPRRAGQSEAVSPDYFRTLRIPQVLGRDLAEAWFPGAPGVVVINRAMARRCWPDQPFAPDHPGAAGPVGKRISVEGPGGPWLTIVGIVEDIRRNGPAASAEPAFYSPLRAGPLALHDRRRAGCLGANGPRRDDQGRRLGE